MAAAEAMHGRLWTDISSGSRRRDESSSVVSGAAASGAVAVFVCLSRVDQLTIPPPPLAGIPQSTKTGLWSLSYKADNNGELAIVIGFLTLCSSHTRALFVTDGVSRVATT